MTLSNAVIVKSFNIDSYGISYFFNNIWIIIDVKTINNKKLKM